MIQEFEELRRKKEWTYVETVALLNTNVQAYKKYVKGERTIKSKRMLRIMEDQLNQYKEKKSLEYRTQWCNKAKLLLQTLDLHSNEDWLSLPENDPKLNDLREHYGLPRKDK